LEWKSNGIWSGKAMGFLPGKNKFLSII
jgi:hypothetical protein